MNSNILFYPLEREKFCTHIPDEDLFIESQSGDSVLKNIFLLLAVLRERIFKKKMAGITLQPKHKSCLNFEL